jgi:hypothetical protein
MLLVMQLIARQPVAARLSSGGALEASVMRTFFALISPASPKQ